MTFSRILSSRPPALEIERQYRPGDLVVIDGRYHQASTLNFYLGARVRVLDEPSGNLWYGSKFPDAPRVSETPSAFAELSIGAVARFLRTDQELPHVTGLPHCFAAPSGGKSIFTNRRPANQ